jgi:hypothetical protein
VEADFRLNLLHELNIPDAILPVVAEPPKPARLYMHCDVDQWEPDLMLDEAIANPTNGRG